MKALFVAWQDPASRQWAPVGQLTRDDHLYRFVYTRGAEKMKNFSPFGMMTDLKKEYISDDLFPLFANRTLAKSRPEYSEYLEWLGMSSKTYDELDELARTGGLRATDSLELFPCPEPTKNHNYVVYFFGRGLRYLHSENQLRALDILPKERLYLMPDIQNEYDKKALLLRTDDPITLVGYAPRYYAGEFGELVSMVGEEKIKVTVERVNPKAPLQFRVLCKLTAPWPATFHPCNKGLFKSLAT